MYIVLIYKKAGRSGINITVDQYNVGKVDMSPHHAHIETNPAIPIATEDTVNQISEWGVIKNYISSEHPAIFLTINPITRNHTNYSSQL